MVAWPSGQKLHIFAGGSRGAGSNPDVATSIFFSFLSSYFYLLAFYFLFSLLTLLASRDFCENVFLVIIIIIIIIIIILMIIIIIITK